MLLLTSTSDLVTVVTGSAGTVKVHASWVDNAGGTITPGRTNTTDISSATTTTVVASPAGSTQRNVKHLSITNSHASVANAITVQHTDGTTVHPLFNVTLAPGERIIFDEDGDWSYFSALGMLVTGPLFADRNYGVNNALAETIDRNLCTETNTTIGTTGQIFCQAIFLRAGTKVSNITFCSATTAAGTPTHYAFGLYNTSGTLLASTADQTTTAWAANTVRSIAVGTPYTVLTTGLYYLAISVVATTVPTIKGNTAATDGTLRNTAPALNGITPTTYATGTLPASITVPLTKGTVSVWGSVS